MGSRLAARIAGYRPKNRPTRAVSDDAERHRPGLDGRRHRGKPGDQQGHHEAEERADEPPNVESVTDSVSICADDVAALRAERLAEPDLPRPFAHHHQHDVHDDDAADHQREATTPTSTAKMPAVAWW